MVCSQTAIVYLFEGSAFMHHGVLVCSLMLLCHAVSRVILHHYVMPSWCVMLFHVLVVCFFWLLLCRVLLCLHMVWWMFKYSCCVFSKSTLATDLMKLCGETKTRNKVLQRPFPLILIMLYSWWCTDVVNFMPSREVKSQWISYCVHSPPRVTSVTSYLIFDAAGSPTNHHADGAAVRKQRLRPGRSDRRLLWPHAALSWDPGWGRGRGPVRLISQGLRCSLPRLFL